MFRIIACSLFQYKPHRRKIHGLRVPMTILLPPVIRFFAVSGKPRLVNPLAPTTMKKRLSPNTPDMTGLATQ
jgi:hypothetical protein